MNALIVRRLLVVILALLLLLVILLPGIRNPSPVSASSPPYSGELAPMANFHLWKITEIFSCADGSIQFIEMFTSFNGQHELEDHTLEAAIQGTFGEVFTFPSDSGQPTSNRFLLLATSNFGSLPGGVTPDFIIPSNFLVIPDGPEGAIISFETVDNMTYDVGELPLDGIQSLHKDFVTENVTTATNSPTNFAGQQGSIVCPVTPNANLAITKKAPATVLSGSRITYTLTVTSSGSTSNTTVILTDTIPSGTTFASASQLIQPVNGVLTWTLGDLLPPLTIINEFFVVTANVPAGSNVVNSNYGVRSDQTSASGLPVTVQVVADQSSTLIYLPTILKNFPPLPGEHDADLISLPADGN